MTINYVSSLKLYLDSIKWPYISHEMSGVKP